MTEGIGGRLEEVKGETDSIKGSTFKEGHTPSFQHS